MFLDSFWTTNQVHYFDLKSIRQCLACLFNHILRGQFLNLLYNLDNIFVGNRMR